MTNFLTIRVLGAAMIAIGAYWLLTGRLGFKSYGGHHSGGMVSGLLALILGVAFVGLGIFSETDPARCMTLLGWNW